jgi:hypothetical protein
MLVGKLANDQQVLLATYLCEDDKFKESSVAASKSLKGIEA